MRASPAKTLTVIAALCPAILAIPNGAAADEAFLCNDGSILKVALSNLEWMKRNNTCIAAHFGLKAPSVLVPPLPPRRAMVTPPRPRTVAHITKAPTPKPVRTRVKRDTAPAIPVSQSETPNFRDVIIINAMPGKSRVFHHRF